MGEKKRIYILGGILIVVILIIPIMINKLLSIENGFIASVFSKNEWFVFWATYITGVFAVLVGFGAILASNKNSELAILQQTKLMQKQEVDRIVSEIMNEVKSQISLFNVPDLCYSIEVFDEGQMFGLKEHILKLRSALYERQIGWNYVKAQYLESSKMAGVTQLYDVCWRDTVSGLNDFLTLQLNILRKVEEVRNWVSQIGTYDKLILNLNQMMNFPQQNSAEELFTEAEVYAREKKDAEKKRDEGNQYIANTMNIYREKEMRLADLQEKLYKASMSFVGELQKVFSFNEERK